MVPFFLLTYQILFKFKSYENLSSSLCAQTVLSQLRNIREIAYEMLIFEYNEVKAQIKILEFDFHCKIMQKKLIIHFNNLSFNLIYSLKIPKDLISNSNQL